MKQFLKVKNGMILTSLVLGLWSCQKEDEVVVPDGQKMEILSEEIQDVESDFQVIYSELEVDDVSTWIVEDSKLLEELLATIELAPDIPEEELVRAESKFESLGNGTYQVTLILYKDPIPIVSEIVCAGEGVSFAKCCKKYLEDHPNGCLVIRSDGADGFTANNVGC